MQVPPIGQQRSFGFEQARVRARSYSAITIQQFDGALTEAMVVLAGKGTKPEQIKEGVGIVGTLQVRQIEEYFSRLRRAGFDERAKRSCFNQVLADISLLREQAELEESA